MDIFIFNILSKILSYKNYRKVVANWLGLVLIYKVFGFIYVFTKFLVDVVKSKTLIKCWLYFILFIRYIHNKIYWFSGRKIFAKNHLLFGDRLSNPVMHLRFALKDMKYGVRHFDL